MVTPLTIYKASAGSGKTFTLATEYIRLLVENPTGYRGILAVTFTNKATEEMKMRILSQLYGIWKQLPKSDGYLKAVQEKTGLPPQTISERAGIGLSNLLNNYNYFRVETIDTFFQSIMRNMARELDLTTNLRIGLNDYQVEELAVDQLIADLDTTDAMLQWILNYIMESISDDKSWNIIGQVKNFGRTIFRDEYKNVSETLDQKLAEPGFFDRYTTRLRELRQAAIEQMKGIADRFFDILDDEGLTVEDFSYGKTGICGFFLKLRQGIFDESILGKRVTDSVGEPSKWYKKSHPRRELLHALADGALDSLLRQAIDEQPRQWRIYKSADLTLRHLNQLRLLGSIEQKVHALNADANRFLLSDTQQLLHALIGDSDSPFIFEKIGTQLEHVMIDEFQDTSTVQWQNFRVLLREAMSHEGSRNLIVGDVKQSIYRWRSGDWRLLNNIQEAFPEQMINVDADKLRFNRRSARTVVKFNNAFFAEAERQERLLLGDDPGAAQLERAYADVIQQEVKTTEGYVSIRLLPAADYQEQTLAELVDIVETLRRQHTPLNHTAILVRANRLIPLIANYFTEHLPDVSLVSDEAFRLDASPAVCIIIQALHLLTHPDDLLARAFIQKTLPGGIPEAYDAQQEELRQLPLYELAEQLFALFGLNSLNDQSAYVCTFFDYLSDFISERPADIDSFVSHWEETLASKTIQSAGIDGVRLISIHKSKGLEFDTVIIPFCDWQLEKSTGNIIWCSPEEEPFSQLPIVPVDYSRKAMIGTIYEADYCHEHLQNVVDNLNLLYVAFTRACRQLFVVGRREAKNSRSSIIESVLPQIAGDEQSPLPHATFSLPSNADEPLLFECGESGEYKEKGKPSDGRKKEANVFLQPSTPLNVTIQSFPLKAEFRQSNQSSLFIDNEESPSPSYIQLGSLLHYIFSTISTTADIDGALNQLETEGVLAPGSQGETVPQVRASLINMIRRRLEHPKVADWFSPRWTLYNECAILSDEDGRTIERRPDRVMTDGKEWIIVDFKFGSPNEEHHTQVQQYMYLLRQMGHEQVKGYLWYVYTNKIVEVRGEN